ncbi:MAG: peptide ABC transporter substrate-binding protein [Dehalococcoidia bacterium]|nr:peptide ABC transporter substrate-binding protein [Dehalococcoidia bacterium]
MVAMVAALACGSDDDGGSGGGDGSPEDAEQVLNVNLGAEPGSLDPQRATDSVSISVLKNLYSGLLRFNSELEVQADLAREVPTVENGGISEDGLTYTFELRDGLKWSDGEPLVAQAFVDAVKHLFEPGSENYYVDFYRVIAATGPDGDANVAVEKALAEGADADTLAALEQAVSDGVQVEAPDDKTVVVHLNRPSPVFNLLTAMWPMYPIRQDLLDAHGDRWTEAGNLVSNGPFSLSRWNHAEDLQLVRNEHWHGEGVHLDVVNMDMIEDTAVAFLAYQNDELDMITLGPAELIQVRGTEREDEFISYVQLSTLGIYFNLADPVMASTEARQALAGSIDRHEYAEVVREAAVLPAFGWIPSGMPGHDAEVGLQFDNDIEASQDLLAKSGHEGAEIVILSAQSSTSVLTAEWLKQQWEQNLGVKVSINVLETATYFSERNAGNWQIVIGGWGADYPDPQNWMPLFRSGAGLNAGNFTNAEYDRLLDEADAETDNDRRIEIYREAQEILIDEAGFSPMYYGRRNALVKPWVKDLVTTSKEGQVPGDSFFSTIFISGRE